VRHSGQQLTTLLLQQVACAAMLGAPQKCLDALSATSLTTLDVEHFFRGQRAHWPNPYVAQYSQTHALSMMIEAARRGDSPFSFWTAEGCPSESARSHYHGSGVRAFAKAVYQPKRGKPKKLESKKRAQMLRLLHQLAALFKQSGQQRVTDKAKEKVGTQPAPFYGPRAIASTAEDAEGWLPSGDASRSAGSGSGVASSTIAPLYRCGDVVIVRPMRATLWVAQLMEPVVELSPGCFNVDRPLCRYFVPTEQLAGFPHALAWWQERGAGLRIADEAAALQRASVSDGVHFSFEKKDRVTRSTICGKFEPSSLSEHIEWRNELASFAVTELALAAAREAVSTRLEDPSGKQLADREDAAAATAEAAERAARATAAAVRNERTAEMARKRKEGQVREQEQKQERAAKKARKGEQ
jgi:hypothetical protein